MEQEIPLGEMTRRGTMTKSPLEMTKAEYAAWQLQNKLDAREYLFSIGQPLVHEKEGEYIAEYPDGRIKHLG